MYLFTLAQYTSKLELEYNYTSFDFFNCYFVSNINKKKVPSICSIYFRSKPKNRFSTSKM